MYLFAGVQDTHLKVVGVEIQSLDYCRKNLSSDVIVKQTIDVRVICAYSEGKDACEVRHQTYFTT